MKKRILILLALLVCICASALAEEDTAALYDQGTEALKAGDYKTAAVYFEKAAELGHPGAQHELGVCYRDGNGVEQSDEKAVKYYQMSADQGYAAGQAALGYM